MSAVVVTCPWALARFGVDLELLQFSCRLFLELSRPKAVSARSLLVLTAAG